VDVFVTSLLVLKVILHQTNILTIIYINALGCFKANDIILVRVYHSAIRHLIV